MNSEALLVHATQTAASRLIAACTASLLVASPAFAQQSGWDGTPISTTVYVKFANASASFRPTKTSAAALSGANDAALVTIRARTSAEKPTRRDEALALARAVAARSYLVAHGVSPLRINLNYVSAGDFIADNQTTDGRQDNQRVEVELIYVPEQQTMEQKYQAAVEKRAKAMDAAVPPASVQ